MTKKFLYLKEHRHATWLELFFDLIFVVAIGRITHYLAHIHHGHLEQGAWFMFILTFIPLWWIWIEHTKFSNQFDSDSRFHRIITLGLMFLLILLSVIISKDIIHNYKIFIFVYFLIRFCLALMYYFTGNKYQDFSLNSHKIWIIYIIGSLVSFCGIFFELLLGIIILYLGILSDILVPNLLKQNLKRKKADKEHLVERIGLLAIILLGESIISMSGSLANVVWNPLTIITASSGFLIICMIWWIYFDSFVLLIKSKYDPNGSITLYSQLATYISLAILANTIRHAILNHLNIFDFRIMAITGMVLFYIGKQTAYFFSVPEYRDYILFNTLIVFIIAGLSLLLSNAQYILIGLAFSMIMYILLNCRAQIKLYGKINM